MRREPLMPVAPQAIGEWRKKVHPVFVEMMEQFKQNEPLSRSPWKEDREKAQKWAKDAEKEFRVKGREIGDQFRRGGVILHDFAGKILDLDLEGPAVKEVSEEQFMLSWLSWYKYGKTWKELQHERTAGKWWRVSGYWRFSKILRGGNLAGSTPTTCVLKWIGHILI